MAYKHLLGSFCLFAVAVAAPCATAQLLENSAAVMPSVAGQEKKKPTPDELPAKPATEIQSDQIYKGKEVDKKPVVKSKPQPEFTSEALARGQGGVVVLRCIFAATGKVTNIHVVDGLPYGLTEAAIDAASRIKFKPALKDGNPVSMWMELQYKFHE